MNGSGTIRILKRDGSMESLDAPKLAGALWRVLEGEGGTYRQACDLAAAIQIYITRAGLRRLSSSALFEMCIKVLRRVGFAQAGERLETHRLWRLERRRHLTVRQEDGQVTYWDKSWLAAWASRSWHVSPAAARIIASRVENDLLAKVPAELARQEIVEMLNEYMAQFGLADAVPVQR